MSSFTQPPWPSWAYANEANNGAFAGYTQYPHYSSYLSDSMEAYQAHHHHLVHQHQMQRSTESKPRLSKEEVETLEAEFQRNHKPNSSTKKALAESMRVDNARINNWFQNRRAREKKERNIREYEARQKLEKRENGGEGAMATITDRKLDLVASSAPFPNTDRGAHRLSSSSHAVRASPVSDEECSQTMFSSDASNAGGSYPAHGSCTSPSNATSEYNDAEFALSTDEDDTPYCGKAIPQTMAGGDFRNPPSIFTACTTNQLSGFPPIAQSSSEEDLSLRSPASFDSVSRRNRRPPPLAIDGRSCSAGASRSGLDMTRKGDAMRRVASATGSMRVSKPIGAPRSPYMLSRSPVTGGFKSSHAPPTPDTPVLGNQPAIISLDTGAGLSDMAVRDPTLRTPPTTPGVSQHLFSLNSIYDMPIAEAGLPSASVGRYNEGVHLQGVSVGTTHYITNAGISQPHTPTFVSPMSQFSVNGGNGAEYAWP